MEKIKKVISVIGGFVRKIFNFIFEKVATSKIFRIVFAVIVILMAGLLVFKNLNRYDSISYDGVNDILDKKEEVVIYYYTGEKNKDIVKNLSKIKVKYYIYYDKDKKEYDKFLGLLNIDKNMFKDPAIIYIKDGRMYANMIGVDDASVIKTFAKGYDLYKKKK